jgi:twitching motility protein PilI
MANKEALRALQTRLAERLQAARTQSRGRSWLAVECSTLGFLFPLQEAGEIFPMVPMQFVPYTNPWFLGVSNLRGHLHGVVDLAGFLGVKTHDFPRDQSRLVGFSQKTELNCALLVDKLAGLRAEEQLQLEPEDGVARPGFAGARFRDVDGRVWQELNLSALAVNEAFLKIIVS